MSRPVSRLVATTIKVSQPSRATLQQLPSCHRHRHRHRDDRSRRSLSQTTCRNVDYSALPPKPPQAPSQPISLNPFSQTIANTSGSTTARAGAGAAPNVNKFTNDLLARVSGRPTTDQVAKSQADDEAGGRLGASTEVDYDKQEEPFHFHVYGHKHNTHITVTKPDRGAIISMSCGQIGFKKQKRGTYDAAHQLAAYVLDKLVQANWHRRITRLEIVLRGFGPGREAVSKILLGTEGRPFRDAVVKVSDATRLKFGGTRSPKPRRLG